MTNEEMEEFTTRNVERLESLRLPLITPGSDDYNQLEEQLKYLLDVELSHEIRSKGNRPFNMMVSYLRSCQLGYDYRSFKKWYSDYEQAMRDADNFPIPSSIEEINEFLYLVGDGISELHQHALAAYRGSSKPTLVNAMMITLYLIAKIVRLMFQFIKYHYRRFQLVSAIK